MDYELPTNFDLIVVGTGIVESMVSAAASRIGKTVLHIDSNEYYGGIWASFNLECIEKLSKPNSNTHVVQLDQITISEHETVIVVGNDYFNLKDTTQEWHIPERTDESDESKAWTQERLLKLSRKFNIDITPKLQFARGDFVELLISSNIARYSEYRSVSRVLTFLNGELEIVPCSRSDVFANSKVSVIEKRMLMKLLTACVDGDEKDFQNYDNKSFYCYLKDKKLTENVIYYVLYAIAMCDIETPCMVGVQSVKRFVKSLGRFGKTPFLYSLYGSGELSQAFCRLSAVFGATYALNQKLNGFIFDDKQLFKGIICGKQRINSEHVVLGVDKSPKQFVENVKSSYTSRAIFIVNKSIMDSEKEHLTLLLFPTTDGKRLCYIMEMGSLTGTCPKDIYIVHMFTKQDKTPKQDLQHCVSELFAGENIESDKPKILWSFFYATPDTNHVNLLDGVPDNVFVCPGPDLDLDIDLSIKKAKDIFGKMYPGCEFLPRAPDPEELIIGDEDEQTIEHKDGQITEKDEQTIEKDDQTIEKDGQTTEKDGTVTEQKIEENKVENIPQD